MVRISDSSRTSRHFREGSWLCENAARVSDEISCPSQVCFGAQSGLIADHQIASAKSQKRALSLSLACALAGNCQCGMASTSTGLARESIVVTRCRLGSTVATVAPKRTA
jgi:hypothetical protein